MHVLSVHIELRMLCHTYRYQRHRLNLNPSLGFRMLKLSVHVSMEAKAALKPSKWIHPSHLGYYNAMHCEVKPRAVVK